MCVLNFRPFELGINDWRAERQRRHSQVVRPEIRYNGSSAAPSYMKIGYLAGSMIMMSSNNISNATDLAEKAKLLMRARYDQVPTNLQG